MMRLASARISVRPVCLAAGTIRTSAASAGAHAAAATAAAFRALEHQRWQKAVAAYDKGFGPLTRQCIPDMLAGVGCASGLDVLDVATGPGFAAQAAAQLGANVVAIDFSSKMLELARERLASVAGHPIRLMEADAAALPFEGASFDAVVCNFGVLHLAVPEDFFAEAARVLKPGGRLGFTVWAAPPATEAFALVLEAVRQHGNPDVPLPEGPPFFRYADAGEAARALAAAGLVGTASRQVQMRWDLAGPAEAFAAFRDGTARTAALLAGQTPEQLRAVESPTGGVQLAMPCVLTTGTKPR